MCTVAVGSYTGGAGHGGGRVEPAARNNDLMVAAGQGDLPAVNTLLKAGVGMNDAKSHLNVVHALLAANDDGKTALMLTLENAPRKQWNFLETRWRPIPGGKVAG